MSDQHINRREQIKAQLAVEWRLKAEQGLHHDHLSDLAFLLAELEYTEAKLDAVRLQNHRLIKEREAALAAAPASSPDTVEAFYRRVNARAEADMLNGRPVTGAHHRALETEIAAYRAASSPEGDA